MRNNYGSGKIKLLDNYVVIDLEMTGLNAKTDRIIEVGAVKVRDKKPVDTYTALVNPERVLSKELVELTGITDEMTGAARSQNPVIEEFFAFLGDDVLVGQNVIFDYSFLKQWASNHKYAFERTAVDTLKLARKFLKPEEKKDLASLCRYFGVRQQNAHRALDDASRTQQIFERMKERFGSENAEAFRPKPLQYKAKRQSSATDRQKRYLIEYARNHQISLPIQPEGMTKSQASRMTDQLIAQYGKLPKE